MPKKFLTMEPTNMSKRILVTGANGQLGSEVQTISADYPNYEFYFSDTNSLDVTDKNTIDVFCQKNSITAIINCAAYTAVDKAEEDVKNADRVNHLAVKYLAEVSKAHNISLVHISTDYVFDGKNYKPYTEDDAVSPQSVYGNSKYLGEQALIDINPPDSIIIRTSWVYSSFGNNFVKTMIRLGQEREQLGVIYDQVGSPTYAKDLAMTILDLLPKLHNTNVGIFHYSNEGVCSWYDFAKTIFELSDIQCKVNPIETKEYPTPATRPHYSILNKTKIKQRFNIEIPCWKDSLKTCLKTLKENT